MNRFSTIDPPAIVAFFMPSHDYASVTNASYRVSLIDQRILSAFEGAQRELSRYEDYPARWDGYQAVRFGAEVLDDAAKILRFSQAAFLDTGTIPSLVTTGPASDGSLDVEMQVGDRRVLMTLYPNDDQLRLSWFQANESRDEIAPLGTQTVGRWLSWLHHSSRVPSGVDQNQIHSR